MGWGDEDVIDWKGYYDYVKDYLEMCYGVVCVVGGKGVVSYNVFFVW